MQSILLASVLAFSASFPAMTSAYNASAIPIATREGWCQAQTAACPSLCTEQGQGTRQNECYPENLYYVCICSDGSRINSTEYSETIPYYTCTLDQGDCITACGSDNDCSNQCRKTYRCGATNPTKVNVTASSSSSSTASSTATSTGGSNGGNGFASANGGNNGNSNSAADGMFAQVGSAFGMGLVAAGVAIGVAFIGL
ncbi:hypothetical protein FN846DRAFT_914237 [Sphaerosporella brunnea]|uniref:DUF7707 domain-containing protein n=1 Tax=Sphaerosporella brunnea TaxID=1250544 RepID=A0A5J5ED46_9PEZI|nr:hypothetical protein FN846DRAFT_914237 [Sphaerosporella brunnea]